MSDHTVEAVNGTRPWSSQKGGPMVDYDLTVSDSAGQDHPSVVLTQKATTTAPTVGLVIDADVITEEIPKKDGSGTWTKKKLKKTPPANGFGGGGGGGNRNDPSVQRSIAMQSSQKVAAEYARLANERGTLPDDFNFDAFLKLAHRLYEQVEEARNE